MCHGLDATLTEIEHSVSETIFPTAADKDEATYRMKSAKLGILAWRRHILRTHNEDQARYDVLDQLDEETVVIHDKRLGHDVPPSEIQRVSSRLVCQARYLLVHLSRL